MPRRRMLCTVARWRFPDGSMWWRVQTRWGVAWSQDPKVAFAMVSAEAASC